MNKLMGKIFIITLLLIFSSCSCYYVNIESLQKEFASIDSSQLIQMSATGIYGETYTYLANPIDSISCVDKNNNILKVGNSPSVEIRVVESSKNKARLYLDRIFIKDSLLFGFESRISENLKVIHLKDIKSIQLFNAKQMFSYAD